MKHVQLHKLNVSRQKSLLGQVSNFGRSLKDFARYLAHMQHRYWLSALAVVKRVAVVSYFCSSRYASFLLPVDNKNNPGPCRFYITEMQGLWSQATEQRHCVVCSIGRKQ